MNQWQNIRAYLNKIEADIQKKAPNKSGKLKESIAATLTSQTGEDFKIEISMLDYGWYQDKGVSGTEKKYRGTPYSFKTKKPPHGVFKSYRPTIAGQYAMAWTVFKYGIKPKNFINPVLIPAYDDIVTFTKEDIWDYIYANNKL
jgi:hypothetical protein